MPRLIAGHQEVGRAEQSSIQERKNKLFNGLTMLLRDIYFLLKPAIPWRLRIALRRILARRLRHRYSSSWPINEAAARAPEGWPGWPDGKKFAFVLTHDVEGKRGLERCRELAEMEMRLGFRSSFNFVPEGEYTTPESLRGFLTSNGFEVGVHDLRHDGTLYRSRKSFRADAEKINRYLETWGGVGFRSGFMFHNLDWHHDLNILYDASTFDTDPFEPQPDGANTIFPFLVSQNGHPGYVELPYTLPQDSTLFLVFQEATIDIWKRKLDWVAQHGGMALVNVHPDYMSFDGRKSASEYRAELYQELLEYVAKHYSNQCWFALAREVARHFYNNRPVSSGLNSHLTEVRTSVSSPGGQTGVHHHESTLRKIARPDVPAVGTGCLKGKRVAVVSFSNYPDDPRPRRAAEALADEGLNVEVLCLMDNEKRPMRETFNGVDIRRIPVKHHRGAVLENGFRYSLFIMIAFAVLAVRSLTRRYHLVHVHNMPDVLVLTSLIPKWFGAKVILDLHDPMPELMMTIFNLQKDSLLVQALTHLEKWSIALADKVITVNHACEKLFISRSCAAPKIRVVMNSPDESIFKLCPPRSEIRPPDETNRPFVIMYHGTLVERNGIDLAVEALARLRESVPTAELRIYGPPTSFLERVMRLVGEKGLHKAVRYLGPRGSEQLVEAIKECDVGVIPNKRNIFTAINTPARIFEYLALGKPVIAPRAPGIQDYFDDNSLVSFELGNAEDLALKLAYVFFQPDEALEIVKRGQKVYLAHSWHEERRKLVNVVAELLSAGHRVN